MLDSSICVSALVYVCARVVPHVRNITSENEQKTFFSPHLEKRTFCIFSYEDNNLLGLGDFFLVVVMFMVGLLLMIAFSTRLFKIQILIIVYMLNNEDYYFPIIIGMNCQLITCIRNHTLMKKQPGQFKKYYFYLDHYHSVFSDLLGKTQAYVSSKY